MHLFALLCRDATCSEAFPALINGTCPTQAFSEMPYEARRCHCLTTMLSRSNKVGRFLLFLFLKIKIDHISCSSCSNITGTNVSIYNILGFASQVDNIVVLTDRWLSLEIQWAVETYRTDVNDKALVVQIHMEDG